MVAPPDDDLLAARALRHAHQGSPALLGVSISVRAGEIVAVTGSRGAGKTTLLRCLAGRLVPDEGEVRFEGVPVHTMPEAARERLRRDRFGWIDGDARLLPELTAWENAALPMLLRGDGHRAARAAAHDWLDRLDVGAIARRRPCDLDQPQRQRVAVARALVCGPRVVFADEPTATLHRADRTLVMRTLANAARTHGMTVLLATCDPEVARHADRAFPLVDGCPGTPMPAQDRESTAPRPASV